MIKVIEAISDSNIGGAGVLLYARLKNSDKNRFATTVLIPRGSRLTERFKSIGISVFEVDCIPDKAYDPSAILNLVKAIKKIAPDIINTHGWLTARIAATLCRVPIRIYTRHCAFPLSNLSKNFIIRKYFGVMTNILSHHIIAVADAAKDNLLEAGARNDNISVIINGSEKIRAISKDDKKHLRDSLGIKDDTVVVVINARLEIYKGHDCFLEAIRIFRDKYEDKVKIKCLIIGEGSRREHLLRTAIDKGIEDIVIFTGFLEDIAPHMNIADINVNCSTGTETSSLALSEGMSLGIPAIASDFGGNTYMVKEGINGFIFPQNSPDVLAEKIFLLAFDKSLHSKMSEHAKQRYEEELNSKNMTVNTEKLYFELFSKHK